ncbi:maestro heat-like repeat-containing protein family member 2A [Phasianus colchicus]|uniref:maestro heat-like repeat-containing protein family member 2A n=1 Tax=Phasianus colchicus TaxID=9054 RepID=UPI00129D7268|nr:maestro heat-like repeat-containing protein family member 2A [Phasianus colchicus]
MTLLKCIYTSARSMSNKQEELEAIVRQGPWLTPQTLLARLLVVAGSPVAGSNLQAAALLLLQKLHSRIHRAVGAMWDAEIPLLLQCVQGKEESFPDSAAWEHRLLKFLRASLETMEDEAWTKGLSCELSRYLSSSPSSSGEKALEQLSKLKPSLGSKDMCEMLALCCKSIVTHPSAEMMLKIRKSQQAARYLQLLQTSLKALGRLMAVLLETEPTRDFFQNIIHVLRRSLTSGNVWERKRALQVCSQLLAVCEELRREDVCEHFGSLVGLLAPLTCDPKPTSRQLAVTCLRSLLQIQAKVTNRVIEMGDTGSLCEGLHACSTVCQLQTSSKIARMVCRNFPLERTVDFFMAIKETFRKAKGMHVRAAGKWMITFLQMYRKDIRRDVPLILYVLRSCTSSTQQSMFMPFVCQAVVILNRCHTEVAIDNFTRLLGPTDSETWRRIREFCLQRWRL